MAFRLLNKKPDEKPVIKQIKRAVESELPELPQDDEFENDEEIEEFPVPPVPTKKLGGFVAKKQPQKVVWHIVAQLPVQPISSYTDDDGILHRYKTIEEYLSEMANAGSE